MSLHPFREYYINPDHITFVEVNVSRNDGRHLITVHFDTAEDEQIDVLYDDEEEFTNDLRALLALSGTTPHQPN